MKKFYPLLVLLLFIASCAPSHFVKPLNKNQHAITATLGGPLIKVRALTTPMPFLNIGYGYGLDSSLTVFSNLNITSALFGNLQMDVGVTKRFIRQKRFLPGLSLSPVLNILYRNTEARKIYPQYDLNFYWEYNKRKNFFYAGLTNWFELSRYKAYEEKQSHHWIWMPTFGHTLSNTHWSFTLEAKIIAPYLSNDKIVVDYQTPLQHKGALGIYIGCVRKF